MQGKYLCYLSLALYSLTVAYFSYSINFFLICCVHTGNRNKWMGAHEILIVFSLLFLELHLFSEGDGGIYEGFGSAASLS